MNFLVYCGYNVGSDEPYEIRGIEHIVGNYFKIEVKTQFPLLDQVDRYMSSIGKVKLDFVNKVYVEKSIELNVE